jgi:hypothetical protein
VISNGINTTKTLRHKQRISMKYESDIYDNDIAEMVHENAINIEHAELVTA